MNRENMKVWKIWKYEKYEKYLKYKDESIKILKYWNIIYESVKVWKYKAVECWEI